ncbi:MAG: adenosylmethionine--8-amino-7-oxononanoate transaminase [Holophagales bacterium]|jgi:adenosylmethionine-8-amino-7-oxononanoate aminotransferase|nr:adenosylmethionine--8-amino-7-oxononanoate transaminase [Holophagales bacterium]
MPVLPTDWQSRVAFDRSHVWHPFTPEKDHVADPPVPVIGAEGVDYLLADGRRVLDGISSWWCNIHGHGHPRLVSALERQAGRLDHVMFAGFTHEPALELAARLRPRLPQSLTRCFFSDDGSTAVEVALKMAFQAQLQKGENGRTRFGALSDGYHGDTLGAVGVGELDNWLTGLFRPLLLACDRLVVPEDPRYEINPQDSPPRLERAIAEIREFFYEHGSGMAAFIAEPLVQGAGGMRFWAPELLAEIRKQCDSCGVYLILDEVMTGFGRTGRFLAIDTCGVAPDFLCLAKGLTGGMLPLALTWTTDTVYELFWGDASEGRTFYHGHTHTANATACAVACASLSLFDNEPVIACAEKLSCTMREAWTQLADHPSIRRARTLGCIAAAEIVDPRTGRPHDPALRYGWKLHRKALDHGLLIRPMGDCLYLMPPLVTPLERVHESVEVIAKLL